MSAPKHINHIITNTTSTQQATDFGAEWLYVTAIHNQHSSDVTIAFGDHGDAGPPRGLDGVYLMDFSMQPDHSLSFPLPIRTKAIKASNVNVVMFFYADRED